MTAQFELYNLNIYELSISDILLCLPIAWDSQQWVSPYLHVTPLYLEQVGFGRRHAQETGQNSPPVWLKAIETLLANKARYLQVPNTIWTGHVDPVYHVSIFAY